MVVAMLQCHRPRSHTSPDASDQGWSRLSDRRARACPGFGRAPPPRQRGRSPSCPSGPRRLLLRGGLLLDRSPRRGDEDHRGERLRAQALGRDDRDQGKHDRDDRPRPDRRSRVGEAGRQGGEALRDPLPRSGAALPTRSGWARGSCGRIVAGPGCEVGARTDGRLLWSGRTRDGRDAPAGVYFIRGARRGSGIRLIRIRRRIPANLRPSSSVSRLRRPAGRGRQRGGPGGKRAIPGRDGD